MRYAIRQYHHSAESTFDMTRSRRILVYNFVYDVICISAYFRYFHFKIFEVETLFSLRHFVRDLSTIYHCLLCVNMADDLNITRAFNLLREATVLLSGSAESATHGSEVSRNVSENVGASVSSPNTVNGSNIAGPSTPTATAGMTESCNSIPHSQNTPGNNQQNVLRSFQSLFSPYSRGRSSVGLSRGMGSRPVRNNKRQRQHASVSSRQAREETWTHEVFCLASTSQEVAPNRELKEVLQRAGLGRIKVRFNAKGDTKSFKETLEQAFPKLMCGGGFELLRRGTSGGNQLTLIQPPPIGYSVQFLRTSYLIGQALLYVRPIQSDLDIETGNDMDSEVKYFIITRKYICQ